MGYLLSSLASLPIDDDVTLYIFVVNGRWQEPLYKMVEDNFANIAKAIGRHAVIAQGLNPEVFSAEIQARYFGEDYPAFQKTFPALVITTAHPEDFSPDSVRLVVPLQEAETRFGGWPNFFAALAEFAQFRNDEFLVRFQPKEDLVGDLNRFVEVKPSAFGISLNEMISWWRDRRQARANR